MLATDGETYASIARRAVQTQYSINLDGLASEPCMLKSPSFSLRLRDAIKARTERHSQDSGNSSERMHPLRNGEWLIVVERNDTMAEPTLSVQRHWLNKLNYPVWEMRLNPAKRVEARDLRTALWRVHFEKEVLHQLRLIASDSKLRNAYKIDSQKLNQQLEATARKLRKPKHGQISRHCLLAIAGGVDGFHEMFNDLEYLTAESKIAARRLEAAINKAFDADIALASATNITVMRAMVDRYTVNVKEIKVEQQGDKFENIGAGAIIINRSALNNALNRVSADRQDVREALEEVTGYIESSRVPDASAAYNEFLQELEQPEARKTRLKLFWDGVVAALPGVTKLADSVAQITTLFT